MKIGIGADHGGYNLKNIIKEHLINNDIEVIDYGTDSEESVDYPDFGKAVAEAVVKKEVDRGIIICGTGIGISIAANKVKGIRAALCTDSYMAQMSMEHNNANVLALGARVLGEGLALDIVDTWIKSKFQAGRHERRVNKISEIEGIDVL